jgi:hypothetical protein
MTAAEHAPAMSKRKLVLLTAGAALLAVVILLVAVIPAEFGRDPTGLGKSTGLSRLWAPDETQVDANARALARVHRYQGVFRSDVIEIPLTGIGGGREGYSLEYKVAMKRDATLIYAWEVIGGADDSDLEFEFHGHTTPRAPGETMTVSTYEKANGVRRAGSLVAPFDGIHGWYFQSWAERPSVIRLRVSGFYELVPSGAPGNEAGVAPNVPAAQARPDPTLRSRTAAQP